MKQIIKSVGYFDIIYGNSPDYNKNSLPITGFFDQSTNEISFSGTNKTKSTLTDLTIHAPVLLPTKERKITLLKDETKKSQPISVFNLKQDDYTYAIDLPPSSSSPAGIPVAQIIFKVR